MKSGKLAASYTGARRQDERLLRNQRHRREIGSAVVGRRLVQKLHLRARRFTAEQKLITVRIGPGDARTAGHAASAGYVFDDDLLAQNL